MERVILHSDINSCYVSVELLTRPELRGQPVAVGGSAEERHGIILAKSEEAKRAGVKTGMALWQARQACPGLVILPPHYDRYVEISRQARALYGGFTDRLEPMGLDESWLDITACHAHKDGYLAAQEIRRRMKKELGVTVSVGVSWNKTFAKLGSDYRKPDAVTVFDRENFRERVWPLPVSDLLFVGRATTRTLAALGIRTIGELANADPETLRLRLGKPGLALHRCANGRDDSPVRAAYDVPPVKSVGNSTTPPRDMVCEDDARAVLLKLTEEAAGRLRESGALAGLAEVSVRYANSLEWRSRQRTLPRPTDITPELFGHILALLRELHAWPRPLRSVGVRFGALIPADAPEQTDLFTDYRRRDGLRRIDRAVDAIREKHGRGAIRYLGSEPLAPAFCAFDREYASLQAAGENGIL